mgnify:CR=1 FL=1
MGIIVHDNSIIWFSNIFLLLNLFLILNFIIKIIIMKMFKIIIIKKLCNIINLNIFIEFGFWKFKFIQFIIIVF